MICPVELAEGRDGAGDESTGSDFAGDGQEDHLVAAEIIGISDRHMRRWRERYEEFGFRGMLPPTYLSLTWPTEFMAAETEPQQWAETVKRLFNAA